MDTITYGATLAVHQIQIPSHLIADAEVPVLTGLQAQGDILIVPVADVVSGTSGTADRLKGGVQVVRGESTGHTHWLDPGFDSPDVTWLPNKLGDQILGVVHIPTNQTAMLTHTDEHGCNAIGSGTYELRRQREQADQIRYVTD